MLSPPPISNLGEQESQLSWQTPTHMNPVLNENVLPLIILSMQLQIIRNKSYTDLFISAVSNIMILQNTFVM